MWTKVVSRDRQLRSGRVLRIWAAAVARLVGSVAEKLYDSKLAMRFAYDGRLLGADSWCVWRTLNAWFNVETWAFPAHGSRIYMSATRPVGLKLNGEREHAQ